MLLLSRLQSISRIHRTTRIVTRNLYKMANYTTIETNFLKPDLDDREYRYIELPNHLKVLLIHDSKADKAAAALDVNIGAFEDPENLPGLAHFCEHLLFMGSTKFPDENEYGSYLSKHGGYSNAYTAAQNTNYFFEVNHENLYGALDRFSGFFTGPLFNSESTGKEINAVDSENKKNLQNDTWRIYQLDKKLSNPNHPYHKFSTGNYKTLMEIPSAQGINVRDELLKFYNKSYSANIMKLCILGREDLDTLSEWATKLFKDVKDLERKLPEYPEQVLTEEHLQKAISVLPVKDDRRLEIQWCVPDYEKHWESKTSRILSHIVGHEGSGSILSYLKESGYANELSAGGHTISDGNAFFVVSIELTDKGLKNYESVIHAVFQYVKMLKLSLPEKRIYTELQDITNATFRYKQKESAADTVSRLAKHLEKDYIPVTRVLSSELFTEYEPELLKTYLAAIKPETSRYTLIARGLEVDSREEWYGTQFKVANYSQELREKLKNPGLNAKFHLPQLNEFIATNFNVTKPEGSVTPLEEPLLLKDDDFSKLWYKKDDRFWQPKGFLNIDFKLPNTFSNLTNSMLTTLYVQLVNDSLKDIEYDAGCANLHLNFQKTDEGLNITLYGFNEKLMILFTKYLSGIKSFQPTKERFEIFKQKSVYRLRNGLFKVPYLQVTSAFHTVMNEKSWSVPDKLKVMENVTFENFKAFIPIIFDSIYVESLVHGNLGFDEAIEVDALVRMNLAASINLVEPRNSSLRSYVLPQGKIYRFEYDNFDKDNVNSCIHDSFQLGIYSEHLSSKALLLVQLMREPCFDTLRTKEQLGYVVFTTLLENRGTTNIRIIIQSEKTIPFLQWRIDEFLKRFTTTLREMSEADFEKHKDALCKTLLENYKNMREESMRYNSAIENGTYNFSINRRKADIVSKLTKAEMMDFFETRIIGSEATRLTLGMKSQVSAQDGKEDTLQDADYPRGELITNLDVFRSTLMAAPRRQAVKNYKVVKRP